MLVFCHCILMASPLVAQSVIRDDRFGIAPSWGSVDDVTGLGVGWIRAGANWQATEPRRGSYQMDQGDLAIMQRAKALGFKVCLPFVGGNTAYGYTDYAQGYANAAAWLVRNYGQYFDAIECLNEPLIGWQFGYVEGDRGGWPGFNDDGSPSNWLVKYMALVNATADAVHAVNPNMPVLGPVGPQSANYVAVGLGVSTNIGGTVEHPYCENSIGDNLVVSIPEQMYWQNWWAPVQGTWTQIADEKGSFVSLIDNWRAFAAAHHVNTKVWHTEFGYSTLNPASWIQTATSYAKQAVYTQRRLFEAAGLGVEHTIIFQYKDYESNMTDQQSNFGIVKSDGTPKPAYYAVRSLIQYLANATTPERGTPRAASISGAAADSSGLGYRCYTFSNSNRRITTVVFWESVQVDQNGNSASRNITLKIPRSFGTSQVVLNNAISGAKTNPVFSVAADNTVTINTSASGTPNVLTLTSGSEAQTYSLFAASDSPSGSVTDSSVELGVKFSSNQAGKVTAIKWFKPAADTRVNHVVSLWSANGALLRRASTGPESNTETASGWQTVTLPSPVTVTANTTYVASVHASVYGDTVNYFASPRTRGPLTAPVNAGVYRYGSSPVFPNQVYNKANYWVDVVFSQ
jgi:hypothetical protein